MTALVGTGTITITGTRVASNGVHTAGYMEVINVDEITKYQTLALFAEFTNIDLAGFTSITYSAGQLDYWNQFGSPFQVVGSRTEVTLDTNFGGRFSILKVQSTSLVNVNKFTLVTIEDFTFDSNASGNSTFTDNLRTGPQDRSYVRVDGSFFTEDRAIVAVYMDYDSYFGDQSIVRSTRHEGVIVSLHDFEVTEVTTFLYYRPIAGDCVIP